MVWKLDETQNPHPHGGADFVFSAKGNLVGGIGANVGFEQNGKAKVLNGRF